MLDPHFIIAVFHILFVVPFLGYIFIQRAATPEWVYTLLFFLGLFVLVYHTFKSVMKFISKSSSLWVNLIHVLIMAPLMIYIGYYSKKTPRAAYEMLGLITFAALGYHTFSIIRMLQTHDDSSDK